jgi:hypothetical protein
MIEILVSQAAHALLRFGPGPDSNPSNCLLFYPNISNFTQLYIFILFGGSIFKTYLLCRHISYLY